MCEGLTMHFANSDSVAAAVPGFESPKTCTKCPVHELGGTKNCIPSRGADNPHFMFVGDHPGKDEDRLGQVIAGRSGTVLDEITTKAGISLQVCRYAMALRCSPVVNGSVEKPKPADTRVCVQEHLLMEIAQQKPHLIVALGKAASVALTGNRSSIDRMRGYQHPFSFPDDFIEQAEAQGMILYEGIPEKTGGIPPQKWDKKTCRSITYPVVVTNNPKATFAKKGQNIAGSIESDLVYARKTVYNEPRLEGVDYRVVQSIDELNQWGNFLIDYVRSGATPWLSFDVETGGSDDTAGLRWADPATEIVSIQVTWREKYSILIPVSHPDGNFGDLFGIAAIREFLRRLFSVEGEAIPIIGTNLPFDFKQVYSKFGVRIASIAFDAKFAHQCLFAGDQPNDLDYLSAKYCGMQGYGDGLKAGLAKLPQGKKAFQNLPLDQSFIDYSCGDTDSVFRMAPIIIQELVDNNLWETYANCFLASLIPMAEMEINGLCIDHEVYDWLSYEMPITLAKLKEPIRHSQFYPYFLQARGCTQANAQMLIDGNAPPKIQKDFGFNPGSGKQKAKLLFEIMGLPRNPERVSEKTGDPSMDKDSLDELRDICSSNGWSEHLAIIESIQEYTTTSKLYSSYILNLPKVVHDKAEPKHELFRPYTPADLLPWSVHPQYKLDGTQTGRLSVADPAIHNMPQKSAVKRLFMSRWREFGGCHLQMDYAAMEVRILACSFAANCPTLKDAFAQGFDAHKYVASIIFGIPIDQVTPEQRKVCKTVNFATLYGSGPENVAGLLGVSEAKARKFIKDYLGALPAVASWKDGIQKSALITGLVTSAFGRIRYLSKKAFSKGDIERRAVNTPIQSTASDVTLTSYVRCFHRLRELGFRSKPYLMIHDSLGFDVYPGEFFELWELLQHEMAVVPPTIYPWLDVPLVVDSDAGYSWGAMASVERLDRNQWKVISPSRQKCEAQVHQLRLAGHQIDCQVAEEIVDGKANIAWYLTVQR